MRSIPSTSRVLACGLTLITPMAGCGGGGNQPGASRGTIQFNVLWPSGTSSRLIPAASKSLKFTVNVMKPPNGPVVKTKIVPRPPVGVTLTTVTLDNIPSVDVKVDIVASPQADGEGNPQAHGTALVKVKANQTVEQTITLDSAIQDIAVKSVGANPSSNVSMNAGDVLDFIAQAFDGRGNLVITGPNTWVWTADNPQAASVVPQGDKITVTASSQATAPVTVMLAAKETESLKSGQAAISVGSGSTDLRPYFGAYDGTAISIGGTTDTFHAHYYLNGDPDHPNNVSLVTYYVNDAGVEFRGIRGDNGTLSGNPPVFRAFRTEGDGEIVYDFRADMTMGPGGIPHMRSNITITTTFPNGNVSTQSQSFNGDKIY